MPVYPESKKYPNQNFRLNRYVQKKLRALLDNLYAKLTFEPLYAYASKG